MTSISENERYECTICNMIIGNVQQTFDHFKIKHTGLFNHAAEYARQQEKEK